MKTKTQTKEKNGQIIDKKALKKSKEKHLKAIQDNKLVEK